MGQVIKWVAETRKTEVRKMLTSHQKCCSWPIKSQQNEKAENVNWRNENKNNLQFYYL